MPTVTPRYRLSFVSTLPVSAEAVARVVFTPAGVNTELHPWLHMRFPAARGQTLASLPTGTTLGRCWLLLFGLIPVDYDDLRFTRIAPDGFDEDSQLLTQRVWRHHRRIERHGDAGCRLHDEVAFSPRFPFMGSLSRLVVAALFRWRHRQLRHHFAVAHP